MQKAMMPLLFNLFNKIIHKHQRDTSPTEIFIHTHLSPNLGMRIWI